MTLLDHLHRVPGLAVQGTTIWEREDADVYCILDGCRVDALQRHYPGAGSYWSVGSTSPDWLSETFHKNIFQVHHPRTAYISGNPYAPSVEDRVQESSEQAILKAKLRVDDAVENYNTAHQMGATELASAELNSSVLSLYWRMYPHLQGRIGWTDADGLDCVTGDTLWQGHHPELGGTVTIQGLKDVEQWINGSITVQEPLGGPKFASETTQQTRAALLTTDAALTIAKVLNQRFNNFGWDASTGTEDIQDGGVI